MSNDRLLDVATRFELIDVYAQSAYNVCTMSRQYTIRRVPEQVDRVLRRRASETGRSFNQIAVEALAKGAGTGRAVYDDLDFMIGSMSAAEARHLKGEIQIQHRIDAELWR